MDSLHVLFSDEGHPVAIRKWSQEPFEGGEEYVRKSDFATLIAACDAALDWADANARAFPIETAPRDRGFIAWNTLAAEWISFGCTNEFLDYADDTYTHWTPLPPPPSNPPLPAPLERLGEVLRRIKGVS